MAHELSSANLRRVVPGVARFPHGAVVLPLWRDEYRQWELDARMLNRGQRRLVLYVKLAVDAWPFWGELPLGTISTVAELREWYKRLGGKGWE